MKRFKNAWFCKIGVDVIAIHVEKKTKIICKCHFVQQMFPDISVVSAVFLIYICWLSVIFDNWNIKKKTTNL